MAELDSLEIRVTANTGDADKKLNKLTESLKAIRNATDGLSSNWTAIANLSKAMQGFEGGNVGKVSNGLATLAKALAKLNDLNTDVGKISTVLSDVTSALGGMQDLNASRFDKLGDVGSKINSFMKGMAAFSGDSINLDNIEKVVDALIRISKKAKDVSPTGTIAIGQAVKSLREAATLLLDFEAPDPRTVLKMSALVSELTRLANSFNGVQLIGDNLEILRLVDMLRSVMVSINAMVASASSISEDSIQKVSDAVKTVIGMIGHINRIGNFEVDAYATESIDDVVAIAKQISRMVKIINGIEAKSLESFEAVLQLVRRISDILDYIPDNGAYGISEMVKQIASLARLSKKLEGSTFDSMELLLSVIENFSETQVTADVAGMTALQSAIRGFANTAAKLNSGAIDSLWEFVGVIKDLDGFVGVTADSAEGVKKLVQALRMLGKVKGDFAAARQAKAAFRYLVDAVRDLDVSEIGEKVAAICALAEALKDIATASNTGGGGGGVGAVAGGMFGSLLKGFGMSTREIANLMKLLTLLKNSFVDMAKGAARALFGVAQTGFAVLRGIGQGLGKAFPKLNDFVENYIVSPIKTGVETIKAVFRNGIGNAIKQGMAYIKGYLQEAEWAQQLKEKAQQLMEAVPALGQFVNGVKNVFRGLFEFINGALPLIGPALKGAVTVVTTAFKALAPVVRAALKAVMAAVKGILTGIGALFKNALVIPIQMAVASVKAAFSGLVTVTKGAFKGVAAQVRTIGNMFKGAVSGLKLFARGAKGIYGAVAGLTKRFNLAGTAVGGFLSKLASRAISMAIRAIVKQIASGFKDGLENLVAASSEAASRMQSLETSMNGLKNAMGSSLYSLLSVFSGVLTQIINMATTAFNAVSALISAIGGGTTYMKGLEVATTKTAKSTKKAGSAAKQLKNQLMSFDEIHQLTENNSSGGGGGGGSGKAQELTGKFALTAISEELQQAVATANFTAIGKNLAEKMNEALMNIPWDTITAKAGDYAQMITTFINGFVEGADAETIGKSISGILTTALRFVNDFWYNTDWSAMGTKIGGALITAIRSVNPQDVGKWLTRRFQAAFKFMTAALNELDWGDISTFMSGVADGITEGFSDFGAFSEALAKFTVEGIRSIDPVKLADVAGDLLTGAIAAIQLRMNGENARLVGDKVTKFFERAFTHVDRAFGMLKTTGREVSAALKDTLVTALKKINWSKIRQELGELAGDFADGISALLADDDLLNALVRTLSGALSSVATLLNDFWTKIDWSKAGETLGGMLMNLLRDIDPASIGQALSSQLVVAVNGLSGLLRSVDLGEVIGFLGGIVNAAAAALTDADVSGVKDGVVNAIRAVFTAARNTVGTIDWSSVKSFIGGMLSAAAEMITAADLPGLVSTLMGAINAMFSANDEGAASFATGFGNVKTAITTAIMGAINAIDGAGLANAIATIIKGSLDTIGTLATPGNIENLANKVLQFIKAAIGHLPVLLKKVGNIASNIMTGLANAMKTELESSNDPGGLGNIIHNAIESIVRDLPAIGEILINFAQVTFKFAQNVGQALVRGLTDALGIPSDLGDFAAGVLTLDLDLAFNATGGGGADDIIKSAQLPEGSMFSSFDFESAGAVYDAIERVNTAWALFVGTLDITGKKKNYEAELESLRTAFASFTGLDLDTDRFKEFLGLVTGRDLKKANASTLNGALNETVMKITDVVRASSSLEEAQTALRNWGAEMGLEETQINDLLTAFGLLGSANVSLPAPDTSAVTEAANAASEAVEDFANVANGRRRRHSSGPGMTAKKGTGDVFSETAKSAQAAGTQFVETSKQAEDLGLAIQVIPSATDIFIYLANYTTIMSNLRSVKGAVDAVKSKSVSITVNAHLSTGAKNFLSSLKDITNGTTISASKISAVLTANAYARGGYPNKGDLFIANENGAEMVGAINGKTAVANENEIGDAIFKYMDAHTEQNGSAGGVDEARLASAIVSALRSAGMGAVYLDGRQLAQSINREVIRSGRAVLR